MARIAPLVPQWTEGTMIMRNQELGLLDTPAKVLAGRIFDYARWSHHKMRRMTLAQIQAVDPTKPDPLGDGGWPT